MMRPVLTPMASLVPSLVATLACSLAPSIPLLALICRATTAAILPLVRSSPTIKASLHLPLLPLTLALTLARFPLLPLTLALSPAAVVPRGRSEASAARRGDANHGPLLIARRAALLARFVLE